MLYVFGIMVVGCNFTSSPKNIEEIDYSKYISKTVKELLDDIEQQPVEYIFFDEPPCFLQGAYFRYPDSIEFKISVRDFEYIKQFDTTMNWDYNEFLKEKIFSIKVSKNNVVLGEFKSL